MVELDDAVLNKPIVHKPFRPEHAKVSVIPAGRIERRRIKTSCKGRSVRPLYVFEPDDRWIFRDTNYPWRCVGRVQTNRGSGTGTLVGPRHLLTASHVIGWGENDAGWLKFQPALFDTSAPFGEAWAETTYSYEKISASPDGEYEVAEDYVVCVLDQRLGDTLGWLGTRVYDDDWDDDAYWVNVGYPGMPGNDVEPSFQGPFSITDGDHPGFLKTGDGLDLETYADLTPGDSGGAIFGWWDDGPYIVGVVSAEGTLDPNIDLPTYPRFANWAGGGSPMVHVVNQARSEFP